MPPQDNNGFTQYQLDFMGKGSYGNDRDRWVATEFFPNNPGAGPREAEVAWDKRNEELRRQDIEANNRVQVVPPNPEDVLTEGQLKLLGGRPPSVGTFGDVADNIKQFTQTFTDSLKNKYGPTIENASAIMGADPMRDYARLLAEEKYIEYQKDLEGLLSREGAAEEEYRAALARLSGSEAGYNALMRGSADASADYIRGLVDEERMAAELAALDALGFSGQDVLNASANMAAQSGVAGMDFAPQGAYITGAAAKALREAAQEQDFSRSELELAQRFARDYGSSMAELPGELARLRALDVADEVAREERRLAEVRDQALKAFNDGLESLGGRARTEDDFFENYIDKLTREAELDKAESEYKVGEAANTAREFYEKYPGFADTVVGRDYMRKMFGPGSEAFNYYALPLFEEVSGGNSASPVWGLSPQDAAKALSMFMSGDTDQS